MDAQEKIIYYSDYDDKNANVTIRNIKKGKKKKENEKEQKKKKKKEEEKEEKKRGREAKLKRYGITLIKLNKITILISFSARTLNFSK